jgi:hypothetical protein
VIGVRYVPQRPVCSDNLSATSRRVPPMFAALAVSLAVKRRRPAGIRLAFS